MDTTLSDDIETKTCPPEWLSVERREGQIPVVRFDPNVERRADIYTCADLRELLLGLIERDGETALCIDLSPISFIDSCCLGVLVGTLRRLPEGDLRVIAPRGWARQLFKITRLDRCFPVRLPGEEPDFTARSWRWNK